MARDSQPYTGQWILIEYLEHDPQLNVVQGEAIAYSPALPCGLDIHLRRRYGRLHRSEGNASEGAAPGR
jgi:hypothetical protein